MLFCYLSLIETEQDKIKMTKIYERYRGLVFKIAKDYLKNNQDAEDAMHDAFFLIAKNISCINEISGHKTKGFVVIVIENVCRNILKKKKKNLVSIDQIEYELASEENIEAEIIKKEDEENLYQIARKLDPKYQEILILRYAKQLSFEEIANILGISNATARKRVQRGRDYIATTLLKNKEMVEK